MAEHAILEEEEEEFEYAEGEHVCEYANLTLAERHFRCCMEHIDDYLRTGAWARNELTLRERLLGIKSIPDDTSAATREAFRAAGMIDGRGQYVRETKTIEEETAMFPPWLREKARALITEERYRLYAADLRAVVANLTPAGEAAV